MTELSDELERRRHEQLDDLLSRWHHWQQFGRVGKGWGNKALVAGDYRISRQYDDENGALYDDEEHETMKALQANVDAIQGIDHMAATALYQLARAQSLGLNVFQSPRLPPDPEARERAVAAARRWLELRLVNSGLLD